MTEQFLDLASCCIIWMVNTCNKYLLKSYEGILMKDFDNFMSSKRIMKYIRKDWLNLTSPQQALAFFTHKKIPRRGERS